MRRTSLTTMPCSQPITTSQFQYCTNLTVSTMKQEKVERQKAKASRAINEDGLDILHLYSQKTIP